MKKASSPAGAVIPDAWDDDWESRVDTFAREQRQPTPQNVVDEASLSKTERLQRHAETNRKLWESADASQTFHFLEASNAVPLTSTFKPQVKVLSRKPMLARRDPVTGLSQLTLDNDDDDAESDGKGVQLSPEEIRAKQKRDREEKQRRYDEARAKIFGESAPSSPGSSPGTVTPPRADSGRFPSQGRGRARGGRASNFDGTRHQPDMRRQNLPSGPSRELYNPNHSPRQESLSRRRTPDGEPSKSSQAIKEDMYQPIRAPRGPDGTGKGFAFARRAAANGS
ncbi:hypothetical protein RJ55_05215 [Drechmeria coniospora]|nr:hypothetical protein RJ55_05215 [Drechmeria coniospora]